jgi:hypothetical protein
MSTTALLLPSATQLLPNNPHRLAMLPSQAYWQQSKIVCCRTFATSNHWYHYVFALATVILNFPNFSPSEKNVLRSYPTHLCAIFISRLKFTLFLLLLCCQISVTIGITTFLAATVWQQ